MLGAAGTLAVGSSKRSGQEATQRQRKVAACQFAPSKLDSLPNTEAL